MPRLKNQFPAYRLHKASGQAVVQLGYKLVYLGAYDSDESRAAYQRAIADWILQGRRHPSASENDPERVTVGELLYDYLQFAERHYVKHGKVTTEFKNIKLAVRPLRRLFETTRCVEFGPRALKAVRQVMIDKGLTRMVELSRTCTSRPIRLSMRV